MSVNQAWRRAAGCLGGFGVFALAATLVVGCERTPGVNIPPPPKTEQLVVVTPHNEVIRAAFEEAFSEWHHSRHDSYVQVRWVPGGTPQCVQYVQEAGRPAFVPAGQPIPDVLFGGAALDHQLLATQGLSQPVDLSQLEAELPPSVGGIATRDPQHRWHSSALSSFGILVARRDCALRSIAEPTSWDSLADPRFYGWLAMADPTRSGSNRYCLLIILQKYGWENGWGIILRIAANCRALAGSSDAVINDVVSGNFLAGFCVNFSALREVGQRGADVLAYITPTEARAITPDPISVLTYALHPEIGKRFAHFCVSDAGQALWGFKPEFREGHGDPLYRYPINPKVYTEHKDRLSVPDNPFEMPTILALDQELEKKRSDVVGPLLLAACGDNHLALQRCWGKIIDAGMHPAALAELLKPVVSEEEAYPMGPQVRQGGDAAEALSQTWSDLFQKKYARVEALLAGS